MLEQINAQLPNNKAQKVSEIMNTVLGGTMFLRHIGFGNAVSKLGSKISDLASGEGSLPERVITNLVPESFQPAARTLLSVVQNPEDAVNQLVEQGQQTVSDVVQQGQQVATASLQRGEQAISQGEEAASEISQQGTGFLDRIVTGIRNLGSRARQATNEDLFDLDNPSVNIDAPQMLDAFTEGPLNINMASRRGLFRLAPESGESDSGQNLGNVFNDAMRNTDTMPDLPVFDGMRTVPQASQLQEEQQAANREFDTRPEAEQPAPEQPAPEQPAPEQPAPEQPAPEQPAPDTQENEQATGEEDLAPTVNETAEAGEATVEATQATSAVSRTAAAGEEIAALGGSDIELGPIFEGALLLGSVIPQLISAFEKPEEITPSFVGEQMGL
jgi:hypothetical protein